MKKRVLRMTALVIVLSVLLSCGTAAAMVKWENPYSDVGPGMWSYMSIRTLNLADILPDRDLLKPYELETRENFVAYLYALHLSIGGKRETGKESPFEDVGIDHPHQKAILWAKKNGVVNGVSETMFAPTANLDRAQVCAILIRYADLMGLSLEKKQEAVQFRDSHRIDDYAKSAVVACQMAQVVTGYPDGKFRPNGSITREEVAALLCRLLKAAQTPVDATKAIDTTENAYLAVYDTFDPPFVPLVPECEAVDLSYFDKVAFVGDSVSVMLEYYCAATQALGNATFLCAGSLSATNALWPVTDASVHPYYNGAKVLVEDGVAASGVEIVYIMLGINNLSGGVDYASGDMVKMIDRILEKSPDVQIVIESVTPMSESSTIVSQNLNNERIVAYNERMQEICEDRGWYFVNVAECVTGENGFLTNEYCSDNGGMGIHFTFPGAQAWTEYLKTHVPVKLVEK